MLRPISWGAVICLKSSHRNSESHSLYIHHATSYPTPRGALNMIQQTLFLYAWRTVNANTWHACGANVMCPLFFSVWEAWVGVPMDTW